MEWPSTTSGFGKRENRKNVIFKDRDLWKEMSFFGYGKSMRIEISDDISHLNVLIETFSNTSTLTHFTETEMHFN